MKKVLPILLVVCTLLALAVSVSAGSQGIRLANVKKATASITLDGAKDSSYVDSFDLGDPTNTTTKGKVYMTWDAKNLYFFVEITDKNLSEYSKYYPADPYAANAATKVSDGTPAPIFTSEENLVDVTFMGQDGKTHTQKQIHTWEAPSFEVIFDPTNTANERSTVLKQARVTYTGLNVYCEKWTGRFQDYGRNPMTGETCDPQFTSSLSRTTNGYNIEIVFPIKNMFGETQDLVDFRQISMNAFYHAADVSDADHPKTTALYAQKVNVDGHDATVPTVGSDWNAEAYSFIRLWDPAVTPDRADIQTEPTTVTTTTSTPVDLGGLGLNKPHTTAPKVTTKPQPAITTAAAAEEGGCSNLIGTGTFVLASIMIVPTAILLKKKKHDDE